MLTSGDVVRMIEERHPTHKDDLISMGLDPILVSEGSDRRVYKVHQDLVIKIGYGSQTKREIDFIAEVYSPAATDELRKLRKHVPPMYYADEQNAVIVMKYYPHRFDDWSPELREVQRIMNEVGVQDVHLANMRKDDQGIPVVVDLGITLRP